MTKTAASPRNNTKLQKQTYIRLAKHNVARRSDPSMALQEMVVPSPRLVVSRQKGNGMNKKAESYLVDIKVRTACLDDLDAIESMVQYWAEVGENLPREQYEIVRDIGSFVVTEEQGKVTGCASLHAYDSRLAEIRSLGVYPGAQRRGQGKALVDHLVEKARKTTIQKVFVLTRVPDFFKKQGFTLTSRNLLPEKIMKDCERCTRQHVCDEVALEVSFDK